MRLKTTIKPIPGAPADLDTIDADAIIWLPHAQGAGAKEVLEAIEQRFRKAPAFRKKLSNYVVVFESFMQTKIQVSTSMSHLPGRSTEMAKQTARVSLRFRIESQDGKRAALFLTRIGCRSLPPRKSLWKA